MRNIVGRNTSRLRAPPQAEGGSDSIKLLQASIRRLVARSLGSPKSTQRQARLREGAEAFRGGCETRGVYTDGTRRRRM
jgi:hypothetical protein